MCKINCRRTGVRCHLPERQDWGGRGLGILHLQRVDCQAAGCKGVSCGHSLGWRLGTTTVISDPDRGSGSARQHLLTL